MWFINYFLYLLWACNSPLYPTFAANAPCYAWVGGGTPTSPQPACWYDPTNVNPEQ